MHFCNWTVFDYIAVISVIGRNLTNYPTSSLPPLSSLKNCGFFIIPNTNYRVKRVNNLSQTLRLIFKFLTLIMCIARSVTKLYFFLTFYLTK